MKRGNEWLQVSNPTVKAEYAGGVDGYEVSSTIPCVIMNTLS